MFIKLWHTTIKNKGYLFLWNKTWFKEILILVNCVIEFSFSSILPSKSLFFQSLRLPWYIIGTYLASIIFILVELSVSLVTTFMAGNVSCFSHFIPHLHQQTITTTAPPPRFVYRSKATSRLPCASLITTHSAPDSHLICHSNNNVRLYLEHSKYLTTSKDGGPPRWFTPLESGMSRLPNSPLLLYLPGKWYLQFFI